MKRLWNTGKRTVIFDFLLALFVISCYSYDESKKMNQCFGGEGKSYGRQYVTATSYAVWTMALSQWMPIIPSQFAGVRIVPYISRLLLFLFRAAYHF